MVIVHIRWQRGAEWVFRVGEVYYDRGMATEERGDNEVAGEDFERAIEVWRRVREEMPFGGTFSIHSWYFTAVAYQHMGEYGEALEHYKQVVERWPDYKYAWSAQFLVGICYERLKWSGTVPKEEAHSAMEKAYKAVIDNYEDCGLISAALLRLGRVYYEEERWIDAAMRYQEFVERYPGHSAKGRAIYQLGKCCEKIGDTEAAVEMYRQLLEITEPGEPGRGLVEKKITELSSGRNF